MRLIIALSGWRGSGKDTAADRLVQRHGFQKHSFAAALKDMVADQYGLTRASLDDRELKDQPLRHLPVDPKDAFARTVVNFMGQELPYVPEDQCKYWTPRALCILEGSVKRAVAADYWVSQVVRACRAQGERHVISDLRYRSEALSLLKSFPLGECKLVRVDRFSSSPSIDPSERDLDSFKFDYNLDNTGGSLLGFGREIDLMMERLAL